MALNDYLLISPRRYVEVPARNTISDQGVKRTSLNAVNKNAARIINMASNLDDLNIANVSKEWLDLQWNQIMQRTYIDLIKGKVQIKDQTEHSNRKHWRKQEMLSTASGSFD